MSRHRDAVELPAVPRRAVEAFDRPVVIKETARDGQLAAERKVERDVSDTIAVVVNPDLVQHIVAELVEVWPAVRSLHGHVVGDDRDVVWAVGETKA